METIVDKWFSYADIAAQMSLVFTVCNGKSIHSQEDLSTKVLEELEIGGWTIAVFQELIMRILPCQGLLRMVRKRYQMQ